METLGVTLTIVAGLVLVGLSLFLARRWFAGSRHRFTRPALRQRALEESGRLVSLVDERRMSRPPDDPVIVEHEIAHRRVTLHDEGTQEIYRREHLPVVAELRQQFAERRIRNPMLDELYETAGNEADLRTVATALEEMARRLD